MNPLSSIKLTVNFIRENKHVIAYSPAFGMSTVGKSEEQAKQRFEEMVRIFWKDIRERKIVDEVLSELGWTRVQIQSGDSKMHWAPPQIHSVDLQVPIMA